MTTVKKFLSWTGRVILGVLVCIGCGGSMFEGTRLVSTQERAAQQQRASCGATDNEFDPHLFSPSAIAAVEPLYSVRHGKHGIERRLLGAQLRIPAQKGVTAEWLERALKCHSARHALSQPAARLASPYFLPQSFVEIDVESDGDGFRVQLRGDDGEDARRILDRARAYIAPGRPS